MEVKTVTVTHRSTYDNMKLIERDMLLIAKYPSPDNALTRKIEDSEKVVWVSKGSPNWWNRMWSGMLVPGKGSYVIFEIEEHRLRKPNGLLKRYFAWWITGYAQLVIEGDVKIPMNAEFRFKEGY